MNKSVWILFGLSALLAAYDIYAVVNSRPGDTISEVIGFFNRYPVVPFFAGIVCGHLFWTRG